MSNFVPPDLPLHARLGMEFVALGKAIRRAISRRAVELGLQDGEWGVLVHLARLGEGINQKDLARRLGNEPHSVVRILNNMEKAGHVTRLIDPEDARGRLVYISDSGRALAEALLVMVEEFEVELFQDHAEAKLRDMLGIMLELREKLSEGPI